MKVLKVKITDELAKLIEKRGGEEYVQKMIRYYIGNVDMPSLYDYNYVCGMTDVDIYKMCALWKTGHSPMDRLFGIKPEDDK